MLADDIHVPPYMPDRLPVRISFVGEAPSSEEIIKREPLVGPSGRVFNGMLRTANLDREVFHITNVFDTQIPGEDDRERETNRRAWMKDEVRVKENFDRLAEEIGRAGPNVIVPLGNTALWAFAEHESIMHFRGAVTPASRIVAGHKLIPTLHPQAVQRNWAMMAMVVGDLAKAWDESKYPDIRYPKVELLVEPTLDDIRAFAKECIASEKLSVDIETGWGQITSIAFAPTASRAMSVPFVDLRKPNKSYWSTAEQEYKAWMIVKEILEAPNPKLGQSFMYDYFWLLKQRGIAVRNYRSDTRLRHKVLYPGWPADLATMGGMYTKIGAWKGWAGRYQSQEKADG